MSAKPSILIGMGLQKKPPAPLPPQMGSSKPPGMGRSPNSAAPKPTDPIQAGAGGKASRDEAGFIPSDQRCGDCNNYTKESKECTKVEGMMQSGDTCKQYFEPAGTNSAMPSENDGDESALTGLGAQ